jgi:hypothetical protein
MAPLSSRWSFDPDAFALSEEARLAASLVFEVDEDHWLSIARFGTWWVRPFARTMSDQLLGLRIIPEVPLSESPVVLLSQHEVETYVSKPAFLVPRLLFPGVVTASTYWDRRRDLSDSAWRELEALHAALGGQDRLEAIKQVLHNQEYRSTFVDAFKGGASPTQHLTEIRPLLDAAPETVRYWKYLHAAVEDWDAPVPTSELGCWQGAAASAAFVVHQPDAGEAPSPCRLATAWQRCLQPPALDSFQSNRATFSPRPIGKSQDRLSLDVATTLVDQLRELPEEWTAHPLWPAILELGTRGRVYAGAAHLDAADALRRKGHPKAAFDALGATSYWLSVRAQEALPSVLEGALLLAEEHGWSDTVEALQLNARQLVAAAAAHTSH